MFDTSLNTQTHPNLHDGGNTSSIPQLQLVRSLPSVIVSVYSIGSRFLKAHISTTTWCMGPTDVVLVGLLWCPFYKNSSMPSTFSVKEPRFIKLFAAQLPKSSPYSLSKPWKSLQMKAVISCIRQLEGQGVDLDDWVQWYAFESSPPLDFSDVSAS